MTCEKCGGSTKVSSTKTRKLFETRYRVCTNRICGHVTQTVEIPASRFKLVEQLERMLADMPAVIHGLKQISQN